MKRTVKIRKEKENRNKIKNQAHHHRNGAVRVNLMAMNRVKIHAVSIRKIAYIVYFEWNRL